MSTKRIYNPPRTTRRPAAEPLEPRRLLAATSYVIDTSNALDLGQLVNTFRFEDGIAFDLTLGPAETHKVFKFTTEGSIPGAVGHQTADASNPNLHYRFLADFNSDGLIELNETFGSRTLSYGRVQLPTGTVYLALSESAPTLTGFANRDPAASTISASLVLGSQDVGSNFYSEIPRTPTPTGTPGNITETFDITGEFTLNFAGAVSQDNPHDRIVINIPPGRVIDLDPNNSTLYALGGLHGDMSVRATFGHYRTVDGVSTPIEFTNQNDRYDYSIISQANQIIIDIHYDFDWSTLTETAAPDQVAAPSQGAAIYAVWFNLADVTSNFDLVPEIPNFITFDRVDSEYAYFRVAGDPINPFDLSGPYFPNNLYYEDNNTPGLQYIPDSNSGDDKVFGDANAFKVPRSASGNYTFYQTNTPIPSHDGYRGNTITYTFSTPTQPENPPSAPQPLQIVPASQHSFSISPFDGSSPGPGAFTLASQRQNTPLVTSIRLINLTSADLPISHIAVTGDFKITGRMPASIPANSEVLVTLAASTKIPKMLLGSIGVYTGDATNPITANLTSYITPTPPRITPSDNQALIDVRLASYTAPRRPTAAQPFSKTTIELTRDSGNTNYKGPVRVVFYLSDMPIGEVLIPNANLSAQKSTRFTLQPPAPALSESFQSFDPGQTYNLSAMAVVGTSIDGPPARDGRSVTITQTVLPATTTDLRPTLSAPKSLKLTGKPTSLKLTLENLGTALLTDRVTIKLFHSADNLLSTEGDNPADLLLGTFTFDITLAAGQKKTFTLRSILPPIPPGQSFLLASASGLTSDNNVGNNTAAPAGPTLFRG